MRYYAMLFCVGLLLSVGLFAGSGPGHAAMPTIGSSAVADTLVEKVGYYYRHRHYGYRPYGYRPYGYRRHYGYGYRRPYGYGYGRRWRY